MKNYRFTAQEINQMKDFILTSINNETEKRTAWRARICYEMEAQCTGTKKSRNRGTRMLALYEQLTTNDLPNWLPTDHKIKFMLNNREQCLISDDIEGIFTDLADILYKNNIPTYGYEIEFDGQKLMFNDYYMHAYFHSRIDFDTAIQYMRNDWESENRKTA